MAFVLAEAAVIPFGLVMSIYLWVDTCERNETSEIKRSPDSLFLNRQFESEPGMCPDCRREKS